MNQIDETKLTAYALGELDEAARREIEARLADEPALRAEVEQIRAVAATLQRELAAEELPAAREVTIAMPRRSQWRQFAVAASLIIAIAGVLVAILLPATSAARRSTPQVRAIAEQHEEQLRQDMEEARTPSATPSVQIDQSTRAQLLKQENQFSRELAFKESVAPAGSPARQPAASVASPALSLSSSAQRLHYELRNGSVTVSGGVVGNRPFAGAVDGRTALDSAGSIEAEARWDQRLLEPDGFNTEAYDRIVDNPFLDVMQNPLSTFSIDVDTASYSNVRRFLAGGQRPPRDAVRIEELLNYFPYDYPPPADDAKEPFAAHIEVASCPWQSDHRLVRIALKGKEIAPDKRPASNLVFLLDVSGSMNQPNKLPLVKRSMRLLLEQLGGEDRVAIVVYAGHSGLVLPSTVCTDANKRSIANAIEALSAGGSTNGEQGIQLAYTIAKENFIAGGTNRVILCTDGDFNVGVTSQGDLTRVIEEKAKGGVFLSVLGFGMGNLKDSTMEKLADKGNGNYAYIDTLSEAKKVLVEQMSGTLVTIAKDVKIQIEFNPAMVSAYRLIGYENRLLAKEDFNDDKKDAGEIGAGHTVTALYEIVPSGAASPTTTPRVDALKYQKPAAARRADSTEMLTLKLRYKQPDADKSELIETAVTDEDKTFAKVSTDFKFASAVAAFGMILRDSPHKGSANFDAAMEWAEDGLGDDASGYRREFLDLVKQARRLTH